MYLKTTPGSGVWFYRGLRPAVLSGSEKTGFFFLHPCRFQREEGYRILFNAAGRSIFIRNNLRCIVRENRA
jgi:hypothetical protein